MSQPWAHSGGHLLAEHLESVASQAGLFAQACGGACVSGPWASTAGLWHDLGKYRAGFQRYVRQDENAHIEGRVAGHDKTHSAAGALWAIQQLNQPGRPFGTILAYLTAGHHAGLADWHGGLKERLASDDAQRELAEALAAQPPAEVLAHGELVAQIPGGPAGFALWVRMLFSCLVDADFLDTEAHFDAGKPQRRAGFPALAQMRQAFNVHMAALPAAPTRVNVLRADILRQCRAKATLPPGFFSLMAPTGGGKTLSSLAFALEHAQAHGQPALASTRYFDASKNLRRLENVREIIGDPDALFTTLERVRQELPQDCWQQPTPWEEIAAQLSAEDCMLAIVNTRKAARALHRLMPEGTLHLSALMCGAHRKDVIAEIKQRLKARRGGSDWRPLRVVSNQLVEAGVDIDFPVVYRALAGLDSIAQAAGRCNREGRLPGKGRVVIFVPPENPPIGHGNLVVLGHRHR